MWSLRLTQAQRAALTELLAGQDELSEALRGALEELHFARWDELPDAELPWDRVADLARAQGIGEADVVWDMCGGLCGPVRSSATAISGRTRSAARAAARRRR